MTDLNSALIGVVTELFPEAEARDVYAVAATLAESGRKAARLESPNAMSDEVRRVGAQLAEIGRDGRLFKLEGVPADESARLRFTRPRIKGVTPRRPTEDASASRERAMRAEGPTRHGNGGGRDDRRSDREPPPGHEKGD